MNTFHSWVAEGSARRSPTPKLLTAGIGGPGAAG